MSGGQDDREKLERGYDKLGERAQEFLGQAKRGALPQLRQLIEQARDKAVELGELTREEAERIGEYLHRDVSDAAEYLSYTGKSLGDWLNFDLDLAETRVMEMFRTMADHTRLELDQIAERARRSQELHTGEIVSPGTLQCVECNRELHFRSTGHIPPCPACHQTVFRRAAR
jgi:hypothetical protein